MKMSSKNLILVVAACAAVIVSLWGIPFLAGEKGLAGDCINTSGWLAVPIRDYKLDLQKGLVPATRSITASYKYTVGGRDYVSSQLDPKRRIFHFRARWLTTEKANRIFVIQQAWYNPENPASSVLFRLEESPFE
jgi:hypothetical protein